jgi:hypothetical protein
MAEPEDRAKHIARFEQMSVDNLRGFKEAVDTFEKAGVRQPRVQKVSSNASNGVINVPDLGRMTTASNITREDVIADDALMTLN